MNAELIIMILRGDNSELKVDAIEWMESSSSGQQQMFDNCYLYLLECYGDCFELVRERAVCVVTQFLERLPPNEYYMVNVTSTLVDRMGRQETVEENEDIRHLYVAQLNTLLTRYVGAGMEQFVERCYVDVVRLLNNGLRDAHLAVIREACACVVKLACAADTKKFQPWSEPLSKALYSLLRHEESLVRRDALRTLAPVVLHFNDESLPRLFVELSRAMMDPAPVVRRQCGELGTLLLMELKARYSYIERLVPLVLSCLKDESPEVRSHIRLLWIKCGNVYYKENQTDLKKSDLTYKVPRTVLHGLERPTIGCRELVQRSLHEIRVISRKARDSDYKVRLHALKLLYQFILHAEAATTVQFDAVLPDVALTAVDEHAEVAAEATKVAKLMGRVFTYQGWCEQGFGYLRRNAELGVLKCFFYMFTASEGVQIKDLLQLSQIFIAPEFTSKNEHDFHKYVIKTVQSCLHKFAELMKLGQQPKKLTSEATGSEAKPAGNTDIAELLGNFNTILRNLVSPTPETEPMNTEKNLAKDDLKIFKEKNAQT